MWNYLSLIELTCPSPVTLELCQSEWHSCWGGSWMNRSHLRVASVRNSVIMYCHVSLWVTVKHSIGSLAVFERQNLGSAATHYAIWATVLQMSDLYALAIFYLRWISLTDLRFAPSSYDLRPTFTPEKASQKFSPERKMASRPTFSLYGIDAWSKTLIWFIQNASYLFFVWEPCKQNI